MRLALAEAAVLLTGLAVLGALLVGTLERALVGGVDDDLAIRAATVADDVRMLAPGGLDEDALAAARLDPEPPREFAASGVYVQLLGTDGRVLRTSKNLPSAVLPGGAEALADARAGRARRETVSVPGGDRIRLLTEPIEADGRVIAIVRVGESLHPVDAVLGRLVGLLTTGGAAVLAGAILATWLLLGRALGPLEQIARTAERIATTGDVNVGVPAPPAVPEIRRLGRSFNRMVERLRHLLESQRQLLADTSHELRNPLTVIRTNLDLLERDLDPRTRLEVATETEEEAERMSRLVADLLLLGREDGAARGELRQVRLDVLAEEIAERWGQLAPDHAIVFEGEGPLVVRGDPDRLRQLLQNLLDNAVRYSPPGARVTVTVERAGSEACLVVEDTGVGIGPEHLPRIFDRFYRVDPARSRATGGTGLGLAIVKHVADAHGGRVHAESEPGRGSRFVVTLPAEPSWSTDLEGAGNQEPGAGRTSSYDS